MKVTALGIWGGYPKANSATSSFLVEHMGFRLLFDCGSGVLASLQNYLSVQELDAVILSHYHHDHIADIGPLQYAKLIQNQLNETDKLLPIYAHNQDKQAFDQLTFQQHTKGIALTEDEKLKIGPFTVHTLRTNHPAYCLAVRLEASGKRIVFTADSGWKNELVSFAQDADIFICEANLYRNLEGQISGHMSGRQAGKLAEKADVKRMILTHLPHFGNLEDLLQEAKNHFGGEAELAEAGNSYEVV
ncbi:MBL fold metallo-hydrolase [Gracilibacillus xinjiangensis]|uniref:MBL fold metallo-hydrolase n=1 Tax=Gracilibacillus xinjiangensis TaxID=1193282 RepID=A0ABV8WYH3_9BACI